MKEKLSHILNHKVFIVSVFALLSIIIFIQADRRFGYTSASPKKQYNIVADGSGFYSYLPQYFIYSNEPNYGFIDRISDKYPDIQIVLSSRPTEDGYKNYNKCFVGTALMQAPFFLVNHGIQKITGGDSDGYSLSYRLALQIAALFYWLLGVVSLFKLFHSYKFSNFSILLGIILITFGSNLNYYVSYYTSYSHIYSFGMVSYFLWIAHQWVQSNSKKDFLLLAFSIGLLVLIRPTNILIVLILPFFFKNGTEFFQRITHLVQKQKILLLFGLLISVFILGLQVFNIYHQTGSILLNSYEKEGFTHLTNPHIFEVLFSYEKGFFIYAPGLLLLIPGIYFLFKKMGFYFTIGWFVTSLLHLYLISSWSTWHFGGGLGMRALIEFMPLYLFPIIALFSESKKIIYSFSIIFLITGVYLYQIFQIQFNQNIIENSEMNKEKFWKVFMKTDGRYSWMLSYDYEQLPTKKLTPTHSLYFQNGNWKIDNIDADSNEFLLNKESVIVKKTNSKLPHYAKLTGTVKTYDPVNNPSIETSYFARGEVVYTNLQPFGNQLENIHKFEKISLEFNPKIHSDFDSIQFVLHHYGKQNDYQNLRLQLFKD